MSITPKPERWDLGGLTDEKSGRVGARVTVDGVRVPDEIRVEGDKLVWNARKATWATPDAVMLNAFTKLAKRTDRAPAIARFAKRFGVFGAAQLDPKDPAFPDEITVNGARWRVSCDRYTASEPLAIWDAVIDSIVAALNIGAELNQRPARVGSVEDWTALGYPDFFDDPDTAMPADARWLLSGTLNRWLRIGQISIRLGPAGGWEQAAWQTQIAVGSYGYCALFGALALQTTLAVAGIDLYCCTGCKLPYVRSRLDRRPKPDQNNYCTDCRKSGAPVRAAVARYRNPKEKRQ